MTTENQRQGRGTHGNGRITIADVARAAGVSSSAVSFALNDRPGLAAVVAGDTSAPTPFPAVGPDEFVGTAAAVANRRAVAARLLSDITDSSSEVPAVPTPELIVRGSTAPRP